MMVVVVGREGSQEKVGERKTCVMKDVITGFNNLMGKMGFGTLFETANG